MSHEVTRMCWVVNLNLLNGPLITLENILHNAMGKMELLFYIIGIRLLFEYLNCVLSLNITVQLLFSSINTR